ncbi:LytS/YhcK type 5TM receptor domain-containing protein [Maledivibacter halophilus]|uniref:histidine kinase n=1 Tax=Maledivibacter halophilus TaxID=36842 RepID=A0A1T5IQR1_9FIRM|nr:LytS/YhcK type 5TM receptor domain-containing protein [Maledivibacter halophilus]SKC41517.1 two-component system, LytT family, sensor histidine kinase LytS [Maledivibacter halophilus]
MKLYLIMSLGNRFGNLFVFAFILSRLKAVRNLLGKKPVKLFDKLVLSIIFGVFGIVGTYFSVEFNGALVNTRVIGVVTGGLLGGPLVGLISGLIAGIHRGLIDSGEFTAMACTISTVFEGLMAGYMGKIVQNKNKKWAYAALTGAIAESMRKVSVLIFSKPFPAALDLVKEIWIPMVFINSVGLALLFVIIENMLKEQEKMGAYQANLTLKIADKVLPYLKEGIYSKNIEKVVKIIYEMTEFDAVSITDREKIVAHIGMGASYYDKGNNLNLKYTKQVLEKGGHIIINDCKEMKCKINQCPLRCFLILPLKENGKIIATLKLYKKSPHAMTAIDLEFGTGMSKLLSTQLTLGKLEQNSKLLATAEFRALQSQINPHFLFNSLTVIASMCRIDPIKARKLIIHLSNFFRKSLANNRELVELDTEINHVKSYVEIEQARFEDKLVVEYDLEDNLDCHLPPLTLQPIVENAIKHGILPKKKGGTVKIIGKSIGEEVEIKVVDNGVGLDKESIIDILNNHNRYRNSIGINNVNQRLKGIFGEEYGLQIFGELNEGTSVILKIPRKISVLEGDRIA